MLERHGRGQTRGILGCLIDWEGSQVSQVAVHVSIYAKSVKLGQAVTLEPFDLERLARGQAGSI